MFIKGLRLGCYLPPVLFNMYTDAALRQCQKEYRGMSIVSDIILITALCRWLGNNALGEENSANKLKKLIVKYKNRGQT